MSFVKLAEFHSDNTQVEPSESCKERGSKSFQCHIVQNDCKVGRRFGDFMFWGLIVAMPASLLLICPSTNLAAGKSKNLAALKKVVPEWLDKGVLSARVGEPLIFYPYTLNSEILTDL